VPSDFLLVDLPVLDLRRGLHDLARDRESDDLLGFVGVHERRRHRVPRLAQEPVLDDHLVAADLGNVAKLVIVACDDFVAFHALDVPRRPGP
jgi:hypothetical protein